MVMPVVPNMIYAVLNGVILVIVAGYLIRASMRLGTPIPILFLIGGICGYVTEPLFDHLVLAWYPQAGAASIGWPMWFALHSGWGEVATRIATLPVFGLECLAIYIIGQKVCSKPTLAQRDPAQETR